MSIIISAIFAAGLESESIKSKEEATVQIGHSITESTKISLKKAQIHRKSDSETDFTNVLKPAAFHLYADKYHVPDNVLEVQIDSEYDMQLFVNQLLTTLPTKVKVTSKMFKADKLESMYEASLGRQVEDITPTLRGLANYHLKRTLKGFELTDEAHEEYNAATIKKAVDEYVKDVVSSLKADTEYKTVTNIYDYLFENFQYNAQGMQFMMVGNLGNGELACNGFSYLADKMFEEAGIKSYIRAGYSHYWNVLTLSDGRELTFDVTSDIVLKEYKATLGLSTKEHINKVSSIGFYSAEYYSSKYHDVLSHEDYKYVK